MNGFYIGLILGIGIGFEIALVWCSILMDRILERKENDNGKAEF